MFNPCDLLEAPNQTVGSLSRADELTAVANGSKGISVATFTKKELFNQAPAYLQRLGDARSLGLIVSEAMCNDGSEGDLKSVYVFALLPDQIWRIPAYLTLMTAVYNYGWSDSAEYTLSSILGYSRESVTTWMKRVRHIRAGWTGKTLFLLLANDIVASVRKEGSRCFPRGLAGSSQVFISYQGQIITSNAQDLLPAGVRLCRVSVNPAALPQIFGRWDGEEDIVNRTIANKELTSINRFWESNLQIYADGVWT